MYHSIAQLCMQCTILAHISREASSYMLSYYHYNRFIRPACLPHAFITE